MNNILNSPIEPNALAPKASLYPKFWDVKTKKLNEDIRLKLKQIAENFIKGFEYPLSIKDIILTGSISNYNWNQFSDVDVHVLVDFNDIPNEYIEAFKDYFNAKKQVWNKSHDILILGHEVEMYVQDSNEPHYSTGVYSVLNNSWNVEPIFNEQEIDFEDIAEKSDFFIEQINKLSELSAKHETQKTISGIEKIRNKIKKFRQAGLEKDGEYSTENLVFKTLRNSGYLEVLDKLKKHTEDKQMGIEEEIFYLEKIIKETDKVNKKLLSKVKGRTK
jgi:hypothetical protein